MRNVIIGCGGVGSWLVPKLVRMERNFLVIDGDYLTEGNLDRQFFDKSEVGRLKAEAITDRYGGPNWECRGEFFTSGSIPLDSSDLLWCCADNHACRKEVLEACDLYGCKALIGANELTDSEAYYYQRDWRDGPGDPRVFYPEINTDRSDDPLSPVGCVEAAQSRGQVQSVLANGLAADLMLHLYWAWFRDRGDELYRPVHHKANLYRFTTIRVCDREQAARLGEPLLA